MFDRIAGVYDAMNGAMTAGLHHRWRERAADLGRIGPGSRVLDLATGTGDLAFVLARRVWPDGEVVGADFAEGMLDRARLKAAGAGIRVGGGGGGGAQGVRPRFEWADAMALPYADDSFDAATVGFGVRNFEDLQRGLEEMVRVVRPGGRVVVLEITTPTRPPLSHFYRLWFDRIVPVLGRATGALAAARAPFTAKGPGASTAKGRGATIAQAYTYLPSSVRRFPAPAALAADMDRAGLFEISYVIMAGGIVAIHAGTVGPERA